MIHFNEYIFYFEFQWYVKLVNILTLLTQFLKSLCYLYFCKEMYFAENHQVRMVILN